MNELKAIDIDFDVYKKIEMERTSFNESPNTVLRRLLGISESTSPPTSAVTEGWYGKGISLPNGTQLRMQYNGHRHVGEIKTGKWFVAGKHYSSPSAAASAVARTKKGSKTNLDGWLYWEVKLPSNENWTPISSLRA